MKDKKKFLFKKITSDAEYKKCFAIKETNNSNLHNNAFNKAWKTRNFEIDKFWQRSAFFWGFIALIFTGYITVATEKISQIEKVMYLDFYLILLGIIFSVAWLLVIKGSKRWQENWEEHIFNLEKEITGPLYKTIYYERKRYYSVSGINKILACVVIITWCFLLLQYIYTTFNNIKDTFESICINVKVLFFILPLIVAIFGIIWLFIKGQSFNGELGELKDELNKSEPGAFFVFEKKSD